SKLGYFGPFGGRFVAETLIPALEELDRAYQQIVPSPAFQAEWRGLLAHYVGRPTPLTAAPRLARALDADGARVAELWPKREDLCHTGAHQINHALGPVLLAQQLGTSPAVQAEWRGLLDHDVGRPTPLTAAPRLARALDADGACVAELWLKREDLCHTGAHKINNALGQVLLAKQLGKTRIIAETGAGQHGVATATACAVLGLPCEVYMGAVDVVRQAPNVARMKMLGARVVPVESGSRTLKDAMNEALRDWVTNVRTTHYCVGSAAGPHPYPSLVRDLQR